MLVSGVAGYACMGTLHARRVDGMKRIYVDAYHNNSDNERRRGHDPRRWRGHDLDTRRRSRYDQRLVDDNVGDGRLVAVARKMTMRIASSEEASSRSTALSAEAEVTAGLQRQVTKFW